MKWIAYYLLTNFCCLFSLYADNFTGRVLSLNDKNPVMYAHILHKGNAIGILTDENGFFTIDKKVCMTMDTLQFSCVGYETLSVCSQTLQEDTLVYMRQAIKQLDEILVVGGNYQIKTKKGVGMRIPGGTGELNNIIDSINGFSELGTLFNLKRPFKIEHVMFQVLKAPQSDAYLRLNVYELINDSILNIKNITNHIVKIEKEKNDIVYKFPIDIPTLLKGKIYISLEIVNFSTSRKKDKIIIPAYLGKSFVKTYNNQKFITYPISLGFKIEGKEFRSL